jgi:hypothetical protein
MRVFALIAAGAIAGALWAAYNLRLAGSSRDPAVFRQLVWAVFATPFFAFIGWLIASPREGWRAAFITFCIYFFAIFAAARVERLALGESGASASKHALYFRLTIGLDLVACLVAALQRGRAVGTIQPSQDPATQSTSPQP